MEHLLSNKERERTLLGYFKKKNWAEQKNESEKITDREILCLAFSRKRKRKKASWRTDAHPGCAVEDGNNCNRACNSCNRAASPGCAVERGAVMLVVKISGVRPSFIWRWTLLRASSSCTIHVSRYFINATVEGQWGLENKLYLSF